MKGDVDGRRHNGGWKEIEVDGRRYSGGLKEIQWWKKGDTGTVVD